VSEERGVESGDGCSVREQAVDFTGAVLCKARSFTLAIRPAFRLGLRAQQRVSEERGVESGDGCSVREQAVDFTGAVLLRALTLTLRPISSARSAAAAARAHRARRGILRLLLHEGVAMDFRENERWSAADFTGAVL